MMLSASLSFASFRILLLAWLVAVCLSPALAAKRHPATSSLDANYTAALAIANRFLQAWQSQNQEDGLLLLSDSAKQHTSEDRLDTFFQHGASAAYEIERGKPVKGGRFTFPVVLFGATSRGRARPRPLFSQIVIAREGNNEWAVDRLP